MQLQQAPAAQQPSGHPDPSPHHWGKRKKRSEGNLHEPKHATAGGGESGQPGTGGSPKGPDQNPSSDEPNPSQLDSLGANPKLQLPSVPASSGSADAGQRTLPPRTPPAAATSPLPATAAHENANQEERSTQHGPEHCAKDGETPPGNTAGQGAARQIDGSGTGASETAAPRAATVAPKGAATAGDKAGVPKVAAAPATKGAGSAAHLPTGLHHLTRHWLPEGQRGEAVLQQLGAADLKAADHMIKNMGQRELRLAFQKVYQCETQSYNNNWLRRKLLEAVGLKATPAPRTLRGGGAGQGSSGSAVGGAGIGMTTRPHATRQPQRRGVSSQGHGSASAGSLAAVGEVTKKVTRRAAADEAEAEAVAALQTMMANKADGGCWGDGDDEQAGCWEGRNGGEQLGSWEDGSEEREPESSMGGSQGPQAEHDPVWKQDAEQERELGPGEGPLRQHQQQQQEQRHQQHQEQEQQPNMPPLWHKPGPGREAAEPVGGSKDGKLGSWDSPPFQTVEAQDGAAGSCRGREGAGKAPMLGEYPAKQDGVWQQELTLGVKAELASGGV